MLRDAEIWFSMMGRQIRARFDGDDKTIHLEVWEPGADVTVNPPRVHRMVEIEESEKGYNY